MVVEEFRRELSIFWLFNLFVDIFFSSSIPVGRPGEKSCLCYLFVCAAFWLTLFGIYKPHRKLRLSFPGS